MAGDEENGAERAANEILRALWNAEPPPELPDDPFTKQMVGVGFTLPHDPPARYFYKDRRPQAVLGTLERSERLDRKTGQRVPVLGADGKQREDFSPIASPFAVTHALRYYGEAHREGLRIAVSPGYRPKSGIATIYVDISRGDLVDQKTWMRLLLDAGLRPFDKRMIAQIVELANPRAEILILPAAGWFTVPDGDGGRPVFACPDGEIIGKPGHGIVAELDRGSIMDPAVAKGGSLSKWKQAAAAPFECEDAPHFALGVMAGFAGPVLALAGLPSAGVVFTGTTSRGKSTAQSLAVSAWSAPDMGRPGLLQSALSTANALEALLSRGNGTVLALDELALMRGEDQGRLIFEIYSGTGKQRMRAEGGLREVASWRTFALLSNERKLADSVREAGGKWTPGAELRLLDVDVSTISPDLPAALFVALDGIRANYGHAGPAFVEALFKHKLPEKPGDLRDLIKSKARELARSMPDNQAKAERAALGLACVWVAGDLAKRFGLLPAFAEPELAVRWAWQRFADEADVLTGSAEDRAISALGLWIIQRWNVTVKNRDATSAGVREAEAWYDDDAVYIPVETLAAAAGGMLPQKALATILNDRDLFAKRGRDHLSIMFGGRDSRIRVYALRRQAFAPVRDDSPENAPYTGR